MACAPSAAATRSPSHLLTIGCPGNQRPSAQAKAQTLAVSECMRRHGVSGFPDPIYTPPSNPQDFSIVEDRGGVILAVPKTIDPGSPGFQAATKSCHFS